jgi:hypothetical protein
MIKFHNPLEPIADQQVSVDISYRMVETDLFAIKATVSRDEIKFCSLNARYRLEA